MNLKQDSLESQLETERQRAELYKFKLAKLKRLEEEKAIREALPHLYLHKRYNFQAEFENELSHRYQIICACNQVGKSSSAIQRIIKIATEKETWEKYWPETIKAGLVPAQWWYLYPSMQVATVEFEEKWRPLLPKDEKDPVYGWRLQMGKAGYISHLEFRSGIRVYFKSYEQSVQNLQSGSCYLICCDEELPVNLLPELQMRVNATRGYMFFVFTATLGQNFWKEVVEDRKKWQKEARIWQVSLYDCQKYADGTPSKWTGERIQESIDRCTTEAEVQRRVFGRFVRDEGLMFSTFSRDKHLVPYYRVPDDWMVYAGIDYGSGGMKAHPSSIAFVAINPTKSEARVIRSWRGDHQVTTCKDVVDTYRQMAEGVHRVDYIYYDWAAKDLHTFAQEVGLPFIKADKDRNSGVELINTLFKTNRLLIMHTGSDAQHQDNIPDEFMSGFKLADELSGLAVEVNKKNAKDDLIDALRYAINAAGFDWQVISKHGSDIGGEGHSGSQSFKVLTIDELRAQADKMAKDPANMSIGEEIEFWQSYLD